MKTHTHAHACIQNIVTLVDIACSGDTITKTIYTIKI